MSSIDNPNIIRQLIERKGNEPARTWKGKKVLDNGRHTTEQIWQYTTGFGGICYKLIYGLYPDGMNDEEAAARFLGTRGYWSPESWALKNYAGEQVLELSEDEV